MKSFELTKLDLELYHEELNNGLNIYIVPKTNVNNVYVTFTTKFGSKHQSFVPFNEKKMIKVPDGVAHFLEHKLFEQEDGHNPFAFFAESGASSNANTSNHKTTYLFSCSTKLEENLEFLLDFVQTPYFTKENVNKEKGIIEQEIKMYQDNPFFVLYEKSVYNSIVKHPIKIPILGTMESITKIEKEDLYTCYNTFYHPNNMILVITGNVKPESILEIIKNNQNKKEFAQIQTKLKVKKYNEPDEVATEEEDIFMNIAIPNVAITYKFNITKIDKIKRKDILSYITLYFEMKFGTTSKFNETLKEEEIINDDLDYTLVDLETHVLVLIFGETEKYQSFLEAIKVEIEKFNIVEETFERKKKRIISSFIYMSDNIVAINNWITNSLIQDGMIFHDEYNNIKKLSFNEFKEVISKITFNNKSVVILKPKQQKK